MDTTKTIFEPIPKRIAPRSEVPVNKAKPTDKEYTTARTILDEVLGFRVDLIDHQFAHAVRDPNGRAYNCTSFIDDRHQMMQAWADYLDSESRSKECCSGCFAYLPSLKTSN